VGFTYVAERNLPKRGIYKGLRYPITLNGLKTHWRRKRALSGVKDFRWHDHRHTYATRILAVTGNLKTTQLALGHSDISTTTKYAHVLVDEVREAMSKAATAQRVKKQPDRKKGAQRGGTLKLVYEKGR